MLRNSPPRPRSKITAAGTTGTTSPEPGSPTSKPTAAVEQPLHHAVDGGQAERGPAGEHQRVDPVDQVARVEQVGLAGARPATAYVDAGHRALGRRQHDGDAAEPAVADALGLADPDAGRRR